MDTSGRSGQPVDMGGRGSAVGWMRVTDPGWWSGVQIGGVRRWRGLQLFKIAIKVNE